MIASVLRDLVLPRCKRIFRLLPVAGPLHSLEITSSDDIVLTAWEQDEIFTRRVRSLGGMILEPGRYISKQKQLILRQ